MKKGSPLGDARESPSHKGKLQSSDHAQGGSRRGEAPK